jgi:hypothetical protein
MSITVWQFLVLLWLIFFFVVATCFFPSIQEESNHHPKPSWCLVTRWFFVNERFPKPPVPHPSMLTYPFPSGQDHHSTFRLFSRAFGSCNHHLSQPRRQVESVSSLTWSHLCVSTAFQLRREAGRPIFTYLTPSLYRHSLLS